MRLDLPSLAAALQADPGGSWTLSDAVLALHPSGSLLAIAHRHRLALVSTPATAPPRLVAALDATSLPETVTSLAWAVFAANAASGGGRRGSAAVGGSGRPPRSPAASSSSSSSSAASPSTALNPKSTPRLEDGCLLVGTSAGCLQIHAERGRGSGGGRAGAGGGGATRGRLLHRQRVHGGPVVSVRLRPSGAGLDTVALDDDISLIAPDAAARLAAVEVRAVGRAGAAASAAVPSTTAPLPPLGVQRWDLARSGCGPRADGIVLGPRTPRLRDALEGREAGGAEGGDGPPTPAPRLVVLSCGASPAPLAAHDAEEHAPRGTAALVADLAASVAAGLLGAARAAVAGGENGGLRAGLKAVWDTARGAVGTPSRPGSAAAPGGAPPSTPGGGAAWDYSSRPPSAASSRPSSGTVTPTGGGGTPAGAAAPDKGGGEDRPPPPGEAASLWRAFADAPRRITALLPAPSGALAATADALGRVMLVDGGDGGRVLRVWKGYRGARLAWVVLGPPSLALARSAAPPACAPALAAAAAAAAASDPPGSLLVLAVYAPRRGVLEAWDPTTGLRLGAARVGGPSGALVPADAILGCMRRLHAPSSGRAAFQPPRPVAGVAPPSTTVGAEAAVEGVDGGGGAAVVVGGGAALATTDAPALPAPPSTTCQPVPKRAKFLAPSAGTATAAAPPRPPLVALAPDNAGASATAAPPPSPAYYAVLYCKRSNKKRINKSFADGALEVKGDSALTLMDDEGKVVGRGKLKGCGGGLPAGATGEVGQWEFEVVEAVPAHKYRSGELFIGRGGGGGGGAAASASTSAPNLALARPAGAPRAPLRLGRPGGAGGGAATTATPTLPAPLFDPAAPGALVLHPGTPGASVPVVADPFLARRLRPHQREGLAFLYAAVTGARTPGHTGCVLAHEMGLGKTLTALALVWTLLRQGPAGRPSARRVVVACPSSLVDNWCAEARKWLGDERLKTIALRPGGDGASAVAGFLHGGVHPVLVASYEALRKVGPSLGGGRVDLLIADEGHRLKASGGNQTIHALKAIGCGRVVLLTGTPLQNNLGELFSVLDFVAPGFLGGLSAFNRVFADPIARSRDPGAKPAEKELGARRAEELASRVEAIVLKGPPAAAVHAATLPPCAFYDVFVRLTAPQIAAYKAVLASSAVTSLTRGGGSGSTAQASVLPAIGLLRALCIAPGLALGRGGGGGGGGGGEGGREDDPCAGAAAREAGLPSLLRSLGAADAADPACSAKIAAAGAIASAAVARGDKVVLVSTSTAALDAAERHFRSLSLITVRIDGGVDATRRQAVVDAFNNRRAAPAVSGQALLLSMRAGGAGLNLVGAAVMIFLDMDWNPAICHQAAARCWRPGQTRPCSVLRLHAAGTIDERLLLRLHHKAGLAVALEAGGGGGGATAAASSRRSTAPAFTPAELRALFSLDAGVAGCGMKGLMLRGDAGEALTTSAASWAVDAREAEAGLTEEEDGAAVAAAPLLAAAAAAATVTWVHREPGGGSGAPPPAVEEEEEEGVEGDEATPAVAAEPVAAAPASDGVHELELDLDGE